jgi:hypothetical protein
MPDTTSTTTADPAGCPPEAPTIAAWLATAAWLAELPVGTVLLDDKRRAWQVLLAQSGLFGAGPEPVGVLAAVGDAMHYEQAYQSDMRIVALHAPFRVIDRPGPAEPDQSVAQDSAALENEPGATQAHQEIEDAEPAAAGERTVSGE